MIEGKDISPNWGATTKLVVGLTFVAIVAALLIRFQSLLGPLLGLAAGLVGEDRLHVLAAWELDDAEGAALVGRQPHLHYVLGMALARRLLLGPVDGRLLDLRRPRRCGRGGRLGARQRLGGRADSREGGEEHRQERPAHH